MTWRAAHAFTGSPHSFKSRVCGAFVFATTLQGLLSAYIYYFSVGQTAACPAICRAPIREQGGERASQAGPEPVLPNCMVAYSETCRGRQALLSADLAIKRRETICL